MMLHDLPFFFFNGVAVTKFFELVGVHLGCHELKKPCDDLLCVFPWDMNMLADFVGLWSR